MDGSLRPLLPVQVSVVAQRCEAHALFRCLLSRHHYLGLRNTVGENLKYLVRDNTGLPLSCLLFGSAPWKTAPRDVFIGWGAPTRERNLIYITNNTRFLILPWVKVPHLASHVLARVSRRLRADLTAKYGHRIYLLETFVDPAPGGVSRRLLPGSELDSRGKEAHRLQARYKRIVKHGFVQNPLPQRTPRHSKARNVSSRKPACLYAREVTCPPRKVSE